MVWSGLEWSEVVGSGGLKWSEVVWSGLEWSEVAKRGPASDPTDLSFGRAWGEGETSEGSPPSQRPKSPK